MKTLYLELKMGAAGDMLTAALLELLDEKDRADFIHSLNHLGIPGVEISCEKSTKCGITGTHMHVVINGEEEGHHHHGDEHHHTHEHHGHEHDDHHHHHEHHNHENSFDHHNHHDHGDENDHHHEHHAHGGHHHSSMADIEHIISHLHASDKVKSDVINVYKIIAEAESAAHGVPVTEIHFHEVGMMDAIADVAAVCALIEKINPDKIVASPVHVGSGTVKCAHGVMPVPAPATAHILKGVPSYSGNVKGELCTPTGAALVKYFANSFGEMPLMAVDTIGYGMGTKDFPEAPNAVRVMIGEEKNGSGSLEPNDSVIVLYANMDDMTGEEAGFALEKLFEVGAREAFYTPVFGKKNRPGYMLTVITDEDHKETIVSAIYKYTTTIGIRESKMDRYILNRRVETVETEYGSLHKKICEGFGVKREKFEYEDLAALADKEGLSLREVTPR